MKIALIQINPAIGAFKANCDAICTWTEKAKARGCRLAIFPELAISGYPPQDLLERSAFVRDHHRAFKKLVTRISGIAVLVGLFTESEERTGNPLHNSAALIENGSFQLIHKRLLPTYDVFDEARYFDPGPCSKAISWQGHSLGITICEDILNHPDLIGRLLGSPGGGLNRPGGGLSRPEQLYPVDPMADLLAADAKINFFINIAASPFHLGKAETREAFFCELAKKTGRPLLYVNQTGGQDSLLFDGQSLVISGSGEVICKAAAFREDMLIVDTETWQAEQPELTADPFAAADCEAAIAFEALAMGTRHYLKKCGFSQAVLGLSGGIDSALTAAIASHALGPENVLGVALPSPYTSQESIEDARKVAENLRMRFEVLTISDIFATQLKTLAPLFNGRQEDVTEQNIQARIRGNLLMALANKFGYLLLSTGNKSEMAVGYCTLYGDMSGGLAVISDVPKTMVYRICHHLNQKQELIPARTISKPPSAELAPDQKDQDDLPPYEILDPILEAYLEEQLPIAEIIARGFSAEVVKDVVNRVIVNEHKRKQAPMGLKITSKAFGYGRRYPTSQQYREND